MYCSKVRRDLHSYIKGDLNVLESYIVKRHIESCTACRDEYIRIKRIQEILTDFSERLVIPADLQRNIMLKIDLNKYKRVGAYALYNVRNWGLSMVAAGLLFLSLNFASEIMSFNRISYFAALKSVDAITYKMSKPIEMLNKEISEIAAQLMGIDFSCWDK